MKNRYATEAGMERIVNTIWKKARENGFSGSDPYDGLNSRLLAPLINRSRIARLMVIQLVKRFPIDLRPFLLVEKGINPKALALFISGISDFPDPDPGQALLTEIGDVLLSLASAPDGTPIFSENRTIIRGLTQRIAEGEVTSGEELGWGYNFPWQSRRFFQPAWFPTVVCTAYAVEAFKDARSSILQSITRKAAAFVENSLNRHVDDTGICFSYSPADMSRVYNASLFGARILARGSDSDPGSRDKWRQLARQAVNYVIARQRSDGSWIYGEAEHWKWVDNLHTGFILEALADVAGILGTGEWDENIERGIHYYRENLFEDDSTAKYYSHNRYPLDPHSFAQGAITFLKLSPYFEDSLQMSGSILKRGIEILWDDRREGFIFRKNRRHRNRIIYLRWSQAWMFRALSLYLKALRESK